MNENYCDLEKTVLENLEKAGVFLSEEKYKSHPVGAAVSGGADSTALLLALLSVLKSYGVPLKVVTVNHNIRSAEESSSDVEFVLAVCSFLKKSGFDVEAKVYTLEKGAVQSCSVQRKGGVEDAARFLRYQCFESFIQENNLSVLCLAHNKNDQEETLLMRFFNGSGSKGLAGIKACREKFLRPLLSVSRFQIESYLAQKNQSFRIDSTNLDTSYKRNKIRNVLVPFLSENFPDWEKGVLLSSERLSLENDFLEKASEDFKLVSESENEVYCSRNDFVTLHKAVQIRVLYRMISATKAEKRIPYDTLVKFLDCELSSKNKGELAFSELKISFDNENVYCKKAKIVATESGFFAIIEKKGIYSFPFGEFEVRPSENGWFVSSDYFELDGVKLPFCLRSRISGDSVRTKDGEFKSLNDIFSDWHVESSKRDLIPVLQDFSSPSQEIKAVFGSVLGLKNWIVLE